MPDPISAAQNIGPKDGCLADVAPTMLALMNLQQPPEMSGQSFSLKRTSNVRRLTPTCLAGSVAFLTLSADGVEAQDEQELERIERRSNSTPGKAILDSERRALDKGVSSLRET